MPAGSPVTCVEHSSLDFKPKMGIRSLHGHNVREIYVCVLFFFFFFFFFAFLEPHPQPMEVPRLGLESELQLPAYTTSHSNAGSNPDP